MPKLQMYSFDQQGEKMARQPGGYIPIDADEYNERTSRVVTPITQRNRQREQLLSKLAVTNKEYGNFSWDKDIPAYEPTALKSKKAWKAREMQMEIEKAEKGMPDPLMSDPNNVGHRQYRQEIDKYRKSMHSGDHSPRSSVDFGSLPSRASYQNGRSHNAPIQSRKPAITRDNVRLSDINRIDLVLHLNDRSTLVVKDVAYKPYN